MTDDHEQPFRRLNDAFQIWDEPQFTVSDVCKITSATPKALEHFLTPSRGLVRLMGDWVNPGTGKRRLFTGSQVLQIAAAYAMNRIGFPQRWSIGLAEIVERRAAGRTNGLAEKTGMTILTYPLKDGDWAFISVYEEDGEERKLPVAVQALNVDRLIDEVVAQLSAIVAGEELPDFSVSELPKEPSPYSPKSNFFRAWEKDAEGRWVYVGLNAEETDLLLASQGGWLEGDDLHLDPEKLGRDEGETREQRERLSEIILRHEDARMKAVGAYHNAWMRGQA